LLATVLIFGPLYLSGAVEAVKDFLVAHGHSLTGMAEGGALYGLPVGVVLGTVIGAAVVLTERWSNKPVLD
jgi:hypothetical protein